MREIDRAADETDETTEGPNPNDESWNHARNAHRALGRCFQNLPAWLRDLPGLCADNLAFKHDSVSGRRDDCRGGLLFPPERGEDGVLF